MVTGILACSLTPKIKGILLIKIIPFCSQEVSEESECVHDQACSALIRLQFVRKGGELGTQNFSCMSSSSNILLQLLFLLKAGSHRTYRVGQNMKIHYQD